MPLPASRSQLEAKYGGEQVQDWPTESNDVWKEGRRYWKQYVLRSWEEVEAGELFRRRFSGAALTEDLVRVVPEHPLHQQLASCREDCSWDSQDRRRSRRSKSRLYHFEIGSNVFEQTIRSGAQSERIWFKRKFNPTWKNRSRRRWILSSPYY